MSVQFTPLLAPGLYFEVDKSNKQISLGILHYWWSSKRQVHYKQSRNVCKCLLSELVWKQNEVYIFGLNWIQMKRGVWAAVTWWYAVTVQTSFFFRPMFFYKCLIFYEGDRNMWKKIKHRMIISGIKYYDRLMRLLT